MSSRVSVSSPVKDIVLFLNGLRRRLGYIAPILTDYGIKTMDDIKGLHAIADRWSTLAIALEQCGITPFDLMLLFEGVMKYVNEGADMSAIPGVNDPVFCSLAFL